MIIIPQKWVERYKEVPDGWWQEYPRLEKYDIPLLVRLSAKAVGVDERLLITRMQLEQSALTYAWNNSDRYSDEDKLRYLCGVDKTDGGPRKNGWFGPERQMLGCALRFKYWYRGKDGPRPEWKNWLGLREDPKYAAGVPFVKDGITIEPANQASADCLRYTSSMTAQSTLRQIGLRLFPIDYIEGVDDWAAPAVDRVRRAGIMLGKTMDDFAGRDPITRQEVAVIVDRLMNWSSNT